MKVPTFNSPIMNDKPDYTYIALETLTTQLEHNITNCQKQLVNQKQRGNTMQALALAQNRLLLQHMLVAANRKQLHRTQSWEGILAVMRDQIHDTLKPLYRDLKAIKTMCHWLVL